ncbi:hypothetical protein MATL_G00083070 [Megalops atlanticus]|uniref:Suppressor APC domain-containing protein n=1 Tax=Megalops atlanticus TaxID=7932 RepID=A0A9D3TDQ3_MEGAT|nr:hypothetical protein MATL_G00083070 [Megalops atlanticus]
MALIATDRSCKLNGSTATCSRLGVRRDCIPSKANGNRNCKMQPTEAEFSTDGLPKAFLHSLRTLFDILDDGKKGYVHISEIESRWQGADTRDLPGGVLECLRRVAPPHGCLTFERFVAGLRYSMLNSHNDNLKPQSGVHHPQAPSHSAGLKQAPPPPQQQAPAQKPPSAHPGDSLGSWGVENKVRPLGPCNGANAHHNRTAFHQNRSRQHEELTSGYAACNKPGESSHYPQSSNAAPGGPVLYSKAGYERTGRSLERIPNMPEGGSYRTDMARTGKPHPHQNRVRSIESLALESPQLQKPSGVEGGGLPRSQSETTTGLAGSRRHGRSRDEQRRHTISNGVDYGMLKQMKELEQEKDSLLAGLDVVERAREWYQNQIHSVTERQRTMGQSGQCTDFFTESSQSRLNVLLPKLQEVNRCLSDLISCSGMPFTPPGTLPSATSSNPQQPPPPAPTQAIQRLKEQNRLLTQEVTDKSERITQLEQEKSALIKQLFEARARNTHDNSALDSTFI